jgi:uncharacterized membrane protein
MTDVASPRPPPGDLPLPAAYDRGKELRHANYLILAGLFVSLLLVVVHVRTHLLPSANSYCSIGESFDCAAVAASTSSIVLGLPWAMWGVLGFIAMLIASLRRSVWLWPLSLIAAVVSVALLAVSIFVVGSICYLCEAVHIVTWILAFLVQRGRAHLAGRLADVSQASNIFAPVAGAALGLILFLPHYWSAFSYKGDPPFATGTTEEGYPWIGAKTPTKTIHEYIDYACDHCRVASARTLRKLGSESGWRIVRRQQPRITCNVSSPDSCLAARMALCSGKQGKFWRADRWLFANWDVRNTPNASSIANDLDLNLAEFEGCLADQKTYEQLNAEALAARKLNIRSTPGYAVDGKKLKEEEVDALFD